MIKLSIVVVSYNNLVELRNTLISINLQNKLNKDNAEVIVIASGYSSEEELIKQIKIMPIQLHFNKDTSLYNAMNLGIEHSSGSHVLFLNSGDKFYSRDSFYKAFRMLQKNKILIGKSIQNYKDDSYIRPSDDDLNIRKKISHQSFFAPICKNKILYDESISISSDSKWIKDYLDQHESIITTEIISKFELGGISNSISIQKVVMLAKNHNYINALRELLKYILFFWISNRLRYRILSKKNNFKKIN